MTQVLLAVEGPTDVPVGERLLALVGRTSRVISDSGGSSAIDARLPRWSQPSNTRPMLVLRDLDSRDGVDCAGELVGQIAPSAPPTLALRIAVRATEAWLLADLEAAAAYFRITRVPTAPDEIVQPKTRLVDLCRESKRARIRKAMVPPPGSGAAFGPGYVELVIDFAANHWRPDVAAERSPSLARAQHRIAQLVDDGLW